MLQLRLSHEEAQLIQATLADANGPVNAVIVRRSNTES